eukprot:scaffold2541_cov262-Pinguiococcus_pyrenoidosus.AAC.7
MRPARVVQRAAFISAPHSSATAPSSRLPPTTKSVLWCAPLLTRRLRLSAGLRQRGRSERGALRSELCGSGLRRGCAFEQDWIFRARRGPPPRVAERHRPS